MKAKDKQHEQHAEKWLRRKEAQVIFSLCGGGGFNVFRLMPPMHSDESCAAGRQDQSGAR